MSLLADLYVSTPDRALDYDERQEAPAAERAQLTGLTFLEFSTLWAILQRVPWEDAHMEAFESILESESGERFIFRFPSKFVATAAALDAAGAAAAAEEWAQTDELSCSAAEVRPAIDELRRVAREALQSGRSLYLWNSV